jgi:hypothetical protein
MMGDRPKEKKGLAVATLAERGTCVSWGGDPVTNDDRFDAALRAHVFHRPFLEGGATVSDPVEQQPGGAPAAPTRRNFASQLEASLVRDLNALAAGLRPPPKKLLPERIPASAHEPAPAAAEAKPASPYAPPSKLPPAAWPAAAASAPGSAVPQTTERSLSPYAPQPQRPSPDAPAGAADRSGGATGVGTGADPVRTVSRYAPPRRPGYPVARLQPVAASPEPPSPPTEVKAVRLPPANGISPEPDEGATVTGALAQVALVKGRVSAALLETSEAAEEPSDSPTAEELAKLYAPAPAATAAPVLPPDSPEARPAKPTSPYAPKRVQRRIAAAPGSSDLRSSDFAPRSGRTKTLGDDGGRVPPIRWQASDDPPSAPILPSWRGGSGGNWTGKAAIALVLIALIGSAGAVVTLESLSAPEPQPGTVAADRPPTGGAASNAATARKSAVTRNLTVAARAPASSVEVIHADDAGSGLAPADGSPLPGSAKVIPLPQPVPPANDPGLRPTRDAASGDVGLQAGTDSKVARLVPPAGGGVAAGAAGVADDPPMDAGDVSAAGGDSPAMPPPRVPTPRPNRDGASPDGVLAYAPAAEPTDLGAAAFAGKSNDKPAAKAGPGPSAGVARVTAWVNMRASADNKAATVKVLSAGSIVTIVQCQYWCEIVADGKRGFVYKSFLKTSGDTASAQ